ncbi:MAG: hypothetical protein KDC41_21845 [Saprospiraceae bacterium]|nr:hypothetical protein [Saprospiraceae bacterium]
MFRTVFSFELTSWLRAPAIYLYAMTFFAIAFLSFAGTAGYFDPPVADDRPQRLLNSPYEIHFILQYFNKFFLFLLPAIIGATLYKDYQSGTHSILYTFPIQKRAYLLGKFLSAYCLVVLVTSSAGLGMLLAELLPGLPTQAIGPIRPEGYGYSYLLFTLPNMLIHGILVFAAVARFRNIYAGFGVIVLLFLLQSIAENLLSGQPFWLALADPFGQRSVQYATRFWTLEQQNTALIPIAGVLLYNRLLWGLIGLAVFALTVRNFRFSETVTPLFGQRRSRETPFRETAIKPEQTLPTVAYRYSFVSQFRTMCRVTRFELGSILGSWMFAGLAVLGLLAVLFMVTKVTTRADMILLPATHLILSIPAFFYGNIALLLTFLYSGMLVHRERAAGIQQLVDATPMPNWVFLLGKTGAILLMQLVLLLLLMLAGISIQWYQGYDQVQIGLYLFHLLFVLFPFLMIWAFASMAVHTLAPNTYAGIFLLLLGWLGVSALDQMGIHSKLLLFNFDTLVPYSDINGYGRELAAYLYGKAYWCAFGALLLVLAYLLWFRGLPQSAPERLIWAKRRFTGPVRWVGGVLLLAFLALGFDIHMKEQAMTQYTAGRQREALQQFEEDYRQFASIVQPKITAVQVDLDIYPEANRFEAEGSYWLVNRSDREIDTLLVKTGFDEITEFSFDRPAKPIGADPEFQFHVLSLEKALLPGDSMQLHFSIENKPNTFFQRNSNVLKNGTFIRQDAFPRFGYFPNAEYGNPSDSSARMANYQSIDSDLIEFSAVVSTSAGQTALAPGRLEREWEEDDRRYFSYRTDRPIKFGFSFHSGVFARKEAMWNDLRLEIFYHPDHAHVLEHLLRGLQASLAYNSTAVGPYLHQQVRIVEFPNSEGSFATAFADLMPISESRFLINTQTTADKIDLPFYIAAHELTHHWWGNQLLPAAALGAPMLTESIAEYLSLNIYAQQYGPEQAIRFLEKQRERYLQGSVARQRTAPPLMLVGQDQEYLAYGKGALAFHALAHYLGEDILNAELRNFLIENQFQGAPYPTSTDLVERLRRAAPDSLKYLIVDLFETVTFHSAAIEAATVVENGEGTFDVDLQFRFQKSSERGDRNQDRPLADYLEIGFYDRSGRLLETRRVKVTNPVSRFHLTLEREPVKLMLDPELLLLERDREDNQFWF